MQPDLQISIVNYNTRDLLDDCLHSLFDQPPRATIGVTVVDNGSTDGSVASVRQSFPQVRVLESGGNIGYGRANNLALLGAPGRYYVVLNSDLILQPGALDTMVGYLDLHLDIGAAGGDLRNPMPGSESLPWQVRLPGDPQTNWAVGELNLWNIYCEQKMLARIFPRSHLYGDYFRAYWKRDADAIIPQACGAFLVVRADLYNALHGFDPRFFMYCEDTDLCRRVRDAGFTVAYVAGALAIHVHGQSSKGTMRPRMIFEHNKSRCYYMAKHYGASAAQKAKAIMIGGALLRVIQRLIAGLVRPGHGYVGEAAGYFSVFLKTMWMPIPAVSLPAVPEPPADGNGKQTGRASKIDGAG